MPHIKLDVFRLLLGALFLFSAPISVSAQAIPPIIDPLEELEREREAERQKEEVERFKARPEEEAKPVEQQKDISTACVDIERLDIKGAAILQSRKKIDEITADFKPGCKTRNDISDLMKEIDEAYISLGYITSKSYIAKQDFKDRILRLTVQEGFVEDIIFKNSQGKTQSWQREKTAFLNADQGILNLRDFEQAIDQVNRLGSAKASMKLRPGKQAGGTFVDVTVEDKDLYRSKIHFDNLGSATTGEDQIRLALTFDNLLRANDIWSLNYVGSLDTNALSFDLSIPFNYFTYSFSTTASDYLIPLTQTSELFGDTVALNQSLNWVLGRDAKTKTHVSASLGWRRARRFINSVELSPQIFTTSKVSLSHIRDTDNAKWALDMGFGRGLDWFNALKDADDIAHDAPHSQFWAIDAGFARYAKPKDWGKWSITGRLKLAPHALYGAEQTPIGSRSTIRGFQTPLLSGDVGYYSRLDGEYKIPDWFAKTPLKRTGAFLSKNVKAYNFLDFGFGHSYAQDKSEFAFGTGGGFRAKYKDYTADLGFEVPVSEPGPGRDFNWRFQFKLSMKAF